MMVTSPARILIIEDDEALSGQLAGLLQGQGFVVEQCQDSQKGLMTALKDIFDLVLLDLVLPTGISVLNKLRQSKQTPVMILAACGAEEARIEGYQKGADDYLPKPYSFAELTVRIEALLRRSRWNAIDRASRQNVLVVDRLCLERSSQQATYAGVDLVLTPIQFRLLWVLVENRCEVLSKPYLYQVVLERSFSRYDRSLDMHLSRIRRKLVDAGMMSGRFATVHGKGYRFA